MKICPRCKSRLWQVPKIAAPRVKFTGLGFEEIIAPRAKAIRRLARKYGVTSLRVFGSVARGEAGPESDVDLLFDSRARVGLLRRQEFREKLEVLLGRKVDLVREEYLKWYVRPQATSEAILV